MTFIKVVLENDPHGYFLRGQSMDLAASSVVAYFRNPDGSVTLLGTGGYVYHTQLGLQKVREALKENGER